MLVVNSCELSSAAVALWAHLFSSHAALLLDHHDLTARRRNLRPRSCALFTGIQSVYVALV